MARYAEEVVRPDCAVKVMRVDTAGAKVSLLTFGRDRKQKEKKLNSYISDTSGISEVLMRYTCMLNGIIETNIVTLILTTTVLFPPLGISWKIQRKYLP